MNLDEMRAGAAFQIQTSRDGVTWDPRQPHPKGIDTLVVGGDHWFDDHHKAWVAAIGLRNALTWQAVRILVRDRRGNIAGAVPVD